MTGNLLTEIVDDNDDDGDDPWRVNVGSCWIWGSHSSEYDEYELLGCWDG
jgi:hypothetical protein